MANPIRAKKIADTIKREIVRLLQRELNDPRLQQVVISDVEMTRDLGTASVFYVIPDDKQAKVTTELLNKAAGFARRNIAKNTTLKYIPKIKFVYDVSTIRAERIDQLLSEDGIEDDPAQ